MRIIRVEPEALEYPWLLALAQQLGQAKYVQAREPYAMESILLGVYEETQCTGFLRLIVLEIGKDVGRPPILFQDKPLLEAYVEAFGVDSSWRRRGIGQRLQEEAIALARRKGCYQIRSRSPVTARENYALKLKMGYAIHPSEQNDSYYFIKTLG